MRMLLLLAGLLLVSAAWAGPPAPASDDDPEAFAKQELCNARGYLAGRASLQRDYDWDIRHAHLLLWPHFDSQILEGAVSFLSEAMIEGLNEVVLDFADPMTVHTVSVNGAPAAFSHADGFLAVALSPAPAQGDTFRLRVEFSGDPVATGFGSFNWDSHNGVDLVWTLSEPEGARDWWPCKDVPDDKFTADLYYRVPDSFKAPGPGLLAGIISNGEGTRTWHWRENYPINSYLIAMTATEYHQYTDIYTDEDGSLPIMNYVFPDDIPDSVEDLGITPAAMHVLDSLFGDYPFWGEKYGHAVFQWGGGMEHQTCTSIGSFILTGEHRYDRAIVHELAHSWWGNSVTLQDWENVWLNEGFAKYSEALWEESRGGQDALTDFMTSAIPSGGFIGPVYNNPVLFGATVYRKGAWVLHMLRWLVDDDPLFFAALRDYYDRHAYGNAHTEGLRADLEAYLGRDLEGFFSQWVYGENQPVYEWAWQVRGGPGAWLLDILVRQTQSNAGLFTMPLSFRVLTPGGERDLRLDNQSWVQLFTVDMGGDQPLDLQYDPENWVLDASFEVPFDITGAPLPAAVTALRGNWPNPFNPRTRLEFSLAAAGPARLTVHDAAGRLVRVLIDGQRPAGVQWASFDGLDDRGRPLAGGLYLARLEACGEARAHRMLLVK